MKFGRIFYVLLLLIPTSCLGNEITLLSKNGITYKCNQTNSKIGEGTYGKVHSGKRIEKNGTTTDVAMKFVDVDGMYCMQIELAVYKQLGKHASIPKFYDYIEGRNNTAVLVIELLGRDLDYMWEKDFNRTYSIKTTLMIGLRVLDIVEYVHGKRFAVGDIHADNFAIGRSDKSKIYIFDFGRSKYLDGSDSDTDDEDRNTNDSKNPLQNDIKEIAYMLIELMNGLTGSIYWHPTDTEPEVGDHCRDMFIKMYEYVMENLESVHPPNHGHLRKLLEDEMNRKGFVDDGQFDWIGKGASASRSNTSSAKPAKKLKIGK